MLNSLSAIRIVLGFVLSGMLAASAAGQEQRYRLYSDEPGTPSLCDAVNLARDTAAVVDAGGELELLTGRAVPFSEVDADGIVSIDRIPAGFIEFADDGEGFRKVWWRWFDGSVVDYDSLTGRYGPSSRLPSDYVGVPCDVCEVIDDLELCGCSDRPGCCTENADCNDDNECTTDLCESAGCIHENRDAVCDDFDACTEDDLCVAGVCAGVVIEGCEVQPDDPAAVDPASGGGGIGPRITFSLCGTGATLAMWLTAVGLVTAKATRRRGCADTVLHK